MKRRIVLPTRTGSYRAIRPLTPGKLRQARRSVSYVPGFCQIVPDK